MVFRIVCLLLVSIIATGSAVAQSSSVSFGIKGGVNMARMDYAMLAPSPEPYFLPMGGITLGTHMSPNLGFDLDLLFVRKGVKDKHDQVPDQVMNLSIRADYAVVSPMLRISPSNSGAGLYFLGGGEVGYLIQGEGTYDYGGAEQTNDITDSMAEWDYGVTFGMGFESAPPGRSSFFLEGRYAHGFANIDPAQSDEYKATTRGFYFLGGLHF